MSRTEFIKTLPTGSYWQQRLHELTRPVAVALVMSLSRSNSLGFEPGKGKGTLVDFVAQEKRKHPEKLLLIRVGEFYESFGVDALMLVEHAGLNPMGRKCRAGCPIQNLQLTLNELTAAGITVAVYEEIAPAGSGSGEYKKLKTRALSQIVSVGSPTYMYEACLKRQEIQYAEPPPFLGVCNSANGFIAVQIHLDSRCWRIHRRLSKPALRALLSTRPYAPPLLVDDVPLHLPFMPADRRTVRASTPQDFPREVLEYVVGEAGLISSSFRELPSVDANLKSRPRPLYLSTAAQIGLLHTPGVPDLPRSLLPPTASAASVQLLRRWLLLPPGAVVGDAMRSACDQLARLTFAIPLSRPVPVGKLVSLLAARQGNGPFFVELRRMLAAMLQAPSLD